MLLLRKFGVALICAGILMFVFALGDGAGMRYQQRQVVMMTEVLACKKYIGSFLVTGDGHWVFLTKEQMKQAAADKALGKFPVWAHAHLDPTFGETGVCPPSVTI